MENAVEALKIAFAVMMLVLALTLSISSFSNASSAVSSIINIRDRETEYTYAEPSTNLTRTVGVETIVPTMYRAYKENIQIYFLKSNGEPLPLYKIEDGKNINYIDLMLENFGTSEEAIKHLDNLLCSKNDCMIEKYKNQHIYNEGLYEFLSNAQFEEQLGEYYQGTGSSQIKKRVITYKKIN